MTGDMDNRFFAPIVILASLILFALIFYWPDSQPESAATNTVVAEESAAPTDESFSEPTSTPQIDAPTAVPFDTNAPQNNPSAPTSPAPPPPPSPVGNQKLM
jgi:cytoskeletal protein RodZ